MLQPCFFRRIVLALLALACPFIFAQPAGGFAENTSGNFLAGTRWKVNGAPFADKERNEYTLSSYDALTYESQMGHFISFDQTTFRSDYNAPCGMDCFTNVSGKYELTSATQLQIHVEKIERHGFCDKGSEVLDRNMTFEIVQEENGWKLVKMS